MLEAGTSSQFIGRAVYKKEIKNKAPSDTFQARPLLGSELGSQLGSQPVFDASIVAVLAAAIWVMSMIQSACARRRVDDGE